MASGGAEDGNELSVTDWDNKFWKSGAKDPPFHIAAPHKTLLKYYDKLFTGRKHARVFIPLCGKSLDLIYLADLGHEVVGLEFSEIAVDGFFAENNLKYTKSEKERFVIYETIGKNITVFRGDFYDLTPEACGKFDVFWDRGSFTAININQRNQYAEIMFKLMKPTSTYLLQVTLYDGTQYGGPPHHVTEESLKATLGRKCSYELLEQKATNPLPIVRNIDWFICVYFLQLKDVASL